MPPTQSDQTWLCLIMACRRIGSAHELGLVVQQYHQRPTVISCHVVTTVNLVMHPLLIKPLTLKCSALCALHTTLVSGN